MQWGSNKQIVQLQIRLLHLLHLLHLLQVNANNGRPVTPAWLRWASCRPWPAAGGTLKTAPPRVSARSVLPPAPTSKPACCVMSRPTPSTSSSSPAATALDSATAIFQPVTPTKIQLITKTIKGMEVEVEVCKRKLIRPKMIPQTIIIVMNPISMRSKDNSLTELPSTSTWATADFSIEPKTCPCRATTSQTSTRCLTRTAIFAQILQTVKLIWETIRIQVQIQ